MDYQDSLRGYGFQINKRDLFVCRYCGADGKKSFDIWLMLSVDHLVPKGHPNRDSPDYMVTACRFCNEADNHYFARAEKVGLGFDGTPAELLVRRKIGVDRVRAAYAEFWRSQVHVLPGAAQR